MGRSMLGKFTIPLLLSTLWPTLVLAEVPRGIGIVTALEGQATVTRVILSQQPLPLKFRDQVFFKDRISTEEHSIVRVLLKDKAVVTVRELSTLTITETEERGRVSVLDMLSGKLSLAVARLRMAPGEAIEIRTPNAVVGVRGTFLVVETSAAPTAQLRSGQAAAITNIYLLEGSVAVFTHRAPSTPIRLGPLQSVTIIGDVAGQVHPIPPFAVAGILQDLKPKPQHTEIPDETKEVMKDKEQAKALALTSDEAKKAVKDKEQAKALAFTDSLTLKLSDQEGVQELSEETEIETAQGGAQKTTTSPANTHSIISTRGPASLRK